VQLAAGSWLAPTNVPGTGGGIDAATATNIATLVAYDPWMVVSNLVSAPTVTVTRANGAEVSLFLTNAATLAFDMATFPTNGAATLGLALHLNGFSVTRGTGVDSNAWAALALSTNTWNDLLFRQAYMTNAFRVRQ
jgi:hypothetical protein